MGRGRRRGGVALRRRMGRRPGGVATNPWRMHLGVRGSVAGLGCEREWHRKGD